VCVGPCSCAWLGDEGEPAPPLPPLLSSSAAIPDTADGPKSNAACPEALCGVGMCSMGRTSSEMSQKGSIVVDTAPHAEHVTSDWSAPVKICWMIVDVVLPGGPDGAPPRCTCRPSRRARKNSCASCCEYLERAHVRAWCVCVCVGGGGGKDVRCRHVCAASARSRRVARSQGGLVCVCVCGGGGGSEDRVWP
jgi:hypothetical protein